MSLILSSERRFSDMLSVLAAHQYPYKYLFKNELILNVEDDEKSDLKWNRKQWEICQVSE